MVKGVQKKANIKATADQFGVWDLLVNRLNLYCLTIPFQIVTLKKNLSGKPKLEDLLDAVLNNPSKLNPTKLLFDYFGTLTAGQIATLNALYSTCLAYKTVTSG